MFHIIIVDDEDVTRGNLEKRIAWDKLDVSVAAVFSNGISALEYCRNTMPDIVLTDVKMPKMDGITLATELRKLSSTCKFIFLSGFADKDYLKSAIHLQALTYIEKPIQLNEVTQAIALAVEQCRREQIEQKNRFRGLFLQYQQMTLALISTPDKNDSVDKFGKIYLDFSTWAQYTVGYLTPNLQLPESRHAMRSKILEWIYPVDSLSRSTCNLIAAFDKVGNLVVIQRGAVSCSDDQDSAIGKLFSMIAQLPAWENSSIGISPSVSRLSDLPLALEQAVAAVNHQFYEGVGKIYRSNSDIFPLWQPSSAESMQFRALLQGADATRAADFLQSVYTRTSAVYYDVLSVKNLYFQLFLEVFEASQKYEMIENSARRSLGAIWQEIAAIPTLRLLHEMLLGSTNAYYQNITAQKGSGKKILEIQQYIRENFASKDLTIHKIAEHLYISHTYLCALYKKATGQTINEYITLQRIAEAKKLLLDPHAKIYEIADCIGITDNNYFSVLFKRYTGYTPTEYRNYQP